MNNNTIVQIQTLASHTTASFSSVTGDFLSVIIIAGAFFIFARYVGRGQFVALLVSLYAGLALYMIFPFMKYLPSSPALTSLASGVALFASFSMVAYFILRRIVVSDFISISTIGLIILSFLGAGFVFALAYQVFPVREVHAFTPAIDALFAVKEYFFWWIAGPLIGLFMLAN